MSDILDKDSEKYTYFIVHDGYVKIGRASCLQSRLLQLQAGNPHKMTISHFIRGDVEKELHDRFDKYRHLGEWFAIQGDLKRFLQDCGCLNMSIKETMERQIEISSEMRNPPEIDLIEDDLLTDAQVGKLLGVSPASVCRYRLKGKSGVRLPWTWHGRSKVTTRACIKWWQHKVQTAIHKNLAKNNHRSRRKRIDPELERECIEAGI